jgi:hypothetical protein
MRPWNKACVYFAGKPSRSELRQSWSARPHPYGTKILHEEQPKSNHGLNGFCFEAVVFDNLCVLRIKGFIKQALSTFLLAHNPLGISFKA